MDQIASVQNEFQRVEELIEELRRLATEVDRFSYSDRTRALRARLRRKTLIKQYEEALAAMASVVPPEDDAPTFAW